MSLLPVGTAWPTVLPVGIEWGQLLPVGSGLVFNVMDYGAHRDGATDDAPHVQLALDACYDSGGGVVYMPAGDYLFHTSRGDVEGNAYAVMLPSNVSVQGAGQGVTNVICDVADYVSNFGAYGATNIGVRSLTTKTNEDGIKFVKCTNVDIQYVTAHDCYIGIAAYGGHTVLISHCVADGTGVGSSLGIALGESAATHTSSAVIENCEVSGYMDGIVVTGDAEHDIDGCVVRDSYVSGNSRCGFRASQASNLAMLRCTAGVHNHGEIVIAGVHTATLTDCEAARVLTEANQYSPDAAHWAGDGNFWTYYGDSSDIVED